MNADGHQILRFERNRLGRDFAVGDIHGCFSALQVALNAIGFDSSIDRLFCAGDLVDRGPESHLVDAWLDKPWFFSTKGNHDLVAHQYALEDPEALSDLTNFGGEWLMALPKEDQARIGRRLCILPLAIQVKTLGGPVGIVHADFSADDWRAIEVPFSEGDRQISLWSTMRFDRMYTEEVRNVRALIHGHITLSVAQQIANFFHRHRGLDVWQWALHFRRTRVTQDDLRARPKCLVRASVQAQSLKDYR